MGNRIVIIGQQKPPIIDILAVVPDGAIIVSKSEPQFAESINSPVKYKIIEDDAWPKQERYKNRAERRKKK